MAKPVLHVVDNAEELQKSVISLVESAATASIADHGFFTLGVSGGSVAKILCQGLGKSKTLDFKQWKFLFCDERHVSFDDTESTYAYYKREFFDPTGIPASDVLIINPKVGVEEAAQDYIQQIRTIYPGSELPSFDMLVLGMGPDGHTCSLFPGHPGLAEQHKIVIPITNSPKPPPSRITLTVPVLNAAKRVLIIATGGSKADAVKGCLEPEQGLSPLPAGLANPKQGELHWFLDSPSSAKLSSRM